MKGAGSRGEVRIEGLSSQVRIPGRVHRDPVESVLGREVGAVSELSGANVGEIAQPGAGCIDLGDECADAVWREHTHRGWKTGGAAAVAGDVSVSCRVDSNPDAFPLGPVTKTGAVGQGARRGHRDRARV